MTRKEYHRRWYEANKDRLREYYRENYLKHKKENPEKLREQRRLSAARWRATHPEYKSVRSEATRIKDRERRRLWRQQNPKEHSAEVMAYRKNNLKKVQERIRVWSKRKRQTDPNWKLKCYLRTRIYNALKGISKSASTVKLLGCSIENLWIHLESQFEEGMCRENYGTFWEVDHIIALALFDLTREEHQRRAFHFSNLQPLTIPANRSKGAKTAETTN